MAGGDALSARDMRLALSPIVGTPNVATSDGSAITSTTDVLVDTVTVPVEAGATYWVKAKVPAVGSVVGDKFFFLIREYNATPASGAQLDYDTYWVGQNTNVQNVEPKALWTAPSTGNQQFSLTCRRSSGTGNITPKGAASQPRMLWVEYAYGP